MIIYQRVDEPDHQFLSNLIMISVYCLLSINTSQFNSLKNQRSISATSSLFNPNTSEKYSRMPQRVQSQQILQPTRDAIPRIQPMLSWWRVNLLLRRNLKSKERVKFMRKGEAWLKKEVMRSMFRVRRGRSMCPRESPLAFEENSQLLLSSSSINSIDILLQTSVNSGILMELFNSSSILFTPDSAEHRSSSLSVTDIFQPIIVSIYGYSTSTLSATKSQMTLDALKVVRSSFSHDNYRDFAMAEWQESLGVSSECVEAFPLRWIPQLPLESCEPLDRFSDLALCYILCKALSSKAIFVGFSMIQCTSSSIFLYNSLRYSLLQALWPRYCEKQDIFLTKVSLLVEWEVWGWGS